MRHLADCVYPGIRPARSLYLRIGLEQIANSFFELSLNRARIDLFLPTRKTGAVVLKSQLEGLHRCRITSMAQASQTVKNHTRLDPPFHLFLGPASIVILIATIVM